MTANLTLEGDWQQTVMYHGYFHELCKLPAVGLLIHECLYDLGWMLALAHISSNNVMLAGSVKLHYLKKLGSAGWPRTIDVANICSSCSSCIQ